MKNAVLLLGGICLMGCGTSMKLAVPEKFKEQATMQHVDGARGNRMSFANFTTSKIKRGMQVSYPGWGRPFFLENLLWNQVGISKAETIENEKAKFRYAITDGRNTVEVFAHERQMTRKHEYEVMDNRSILSGMEVLQEHRYVFSALIAVDTAQEAKNWELMMTNMYDRHAEHDKNPFTFVKQEDEGLATNGIDTIHIKPLSIKKTELSNGKTGQLPFKLMSGYELRTRDGVIAIVDLIDRNIWFYNELTPAEKLNVSAITTALFARKVHDTKW
ncbi:hypothetical protein [Chitinophaga qingshengii]|uniref:DUF3108 domain-containing protein n=1 Tax=Chitinophaga qingshengii TaxID=1569794 RepID=A0ABR7TQR6_9BACT|nr:hypothetical protein [Chitinophaga qingshengii]MBC9932813.1 hypothetical protein [Chitinophaga qingshengii]